MTTEARKRARGASTARKRQAQRRTPPKPRGGKKFEEELQVTLDHRQRIDAEYVQLQQQRQQVDARMEELRLQAHQALGREQVLRELRGETPPLPPVALVDAARNGDGASEPEGESEPEAEPEG